MADWKAARTAGAALPFVRRRPLDRGRVDPFPAAAPAGGAASAPIAQHTRSVQAGQRLRRAGVHSRFCTLTA